MSVHSTQANGQLNDSLVVCKTLQNDKVLGHLERVTRHAAVFEIYDPTVVLRASEVLREFSIVLHSRIIYSGRAVVRNVLHLGSTLVCETTLDDSSWVDVDFNSESLRNGMLRAQFSEFLGEWQKLYQILPEYKLIIADMQSFFFDLRLWLDQVELGIRSTSATNSEQLGQDVSEELSQTVIPCVNVLFEKFEAIAQRLDDDLQPAHQNYMRRHLHPLVLCAPFAGRTFHKPLGYAGDYEMVNMIARNRHEGDSLFAKVVNTWFLRQPPAEAHRNRIEYLTQLLADETLRVCRLHRPARVFNMACGPAQEVQKLLCESPLSDHVKITMLDFNEETLRYVQSMLDDLKQRHSRRMSVEYIKKSVHHILKESGRSTALSGPNGYDLVYCAGLFDYLPNPVCQRLTNLMYDWLAPGGLLVATNVEPSNPLRNGMEHLLDWHLIYRTADQLRLLAPAAADRDACCVRTDATGVNVLLEVRKPDHA